METYIQNWDYYYRAIIVSQQGSVFVEYNDLYAEDGSAFIWGLNVLVGCRGKGYGKKLLQYAEEFAKTKKVKRCFLDWQEDSPRWILDFYLRNGYIEIDVEDNFTHKLYKDI